MSSPTDRTVSRLTIRFWRNNRIEIDHKASFILEYTECRADRSNANDDNPYVSAKYTKCKAEKASVSEEHTEFTSYTRSVSRDIVKVTAEHTEFMGDTRNTIADIVNAIADIVKVTAEYPEFTVYTSNVNRNNRSVTIVHPNSGSSRIAGWGRSSFIHNHLSMPQSPLATLEKSIR